MTRMQRDRVARVLVAAALFAFLLAPGTLRAEQRHGCFAGDDLAGGQALATVVVEQFDDWFQITGQIRSTGLGQMYRFSADGHSGAGRLIQRHEYEAGATYVQIRDLSERQLIMEVEGYGVLHLRQVGC